MGLAQPPVLVAPSILAANPLRLAEDVLSVAQAGADWIHVDVMDGHFVPNLTFGPHSVAALRKITDLPLDVHLMVQKPEGFIDAFASAGADVLTVHPEATPHIHRALQSIRALGKQAGIALNPGTSVDALRPLLDDIDLVLVMSVNPGFGGQRFIGNSLEKVRRIRDLLAHRYPKVHVEVDGGVSVANAAQLIDAGANILVAGTAIFAQSDYRQALNGLRHPAKGTIFRTETGNRA